MQNQLEKALETEMETTLGLCYVFTATDHRAGKTS